MVNTVIDAWQARAFDLYGLKLQPARYGHQCPRWVIRKRCTRIKPNSFGIDPEDPCNKFKYLNDHTAWWKDRDGKRVVTWEPYPGASGGRHLEGLILWGREQGINVDVLNRSMWSPEGIGGTILIRFTAA